MIKVGFIGAGGIAQAHMRNLAKMRGVKITAICDIQPDRASEVASNYDAAAYTNHKAMLKEAGLDAVYICVIPAAHKSIELDVIAAKLPFYCEKPVNLSLKQGEKALEAATKAKLITAVGYHWRHQGGAQAAKKFLAKKTPTLVDGAWYGRMPGVPWWRQMKLSGGQIVEQTTHVFDCARYLVGEVNRVHAIATTGAMTNVENFSVHDASVVSLEFESGAIGVITSGCMADGVGGRIELAIKGRGWTAIVDHHGGGTLIDQKKTKPVEAITKYENGLGPADAAFIAAVKNNDQSKVFSPYASGLQSLAVTLAANKSIKSGRPVKVERFV